MRANARVKVNSALCQHHSILITEPTRCSRQTRVTSKTTEEKRRVSALPRAGDSASSCRAARTGPRRKRWSLNRCDAEKKKRQGTRTRLHQKNRGQQGHHKHMFKARASDGRQSTRKQTPSHPIRTIPDRSFSPCIPWLSTPMSYINVDNVDNFPAFNNLPQPALRSAPCRCDLRRSPL